MTSFSGRQVTGCLLLHGFTGTPWVFDELAARLADRGIRVSVPLLPGHGTTPADLADIAWREWVECAEQAFEMLAEECSRVFVAGISMGGALALLLASRHRCAGVVTLAAPVRLQGFRLHLIPLLKLIKRYWNKQTAAGALPTEAGYRCYPLAGIQQFRMLLREVREHLEGVACPALILHSRGDRRIDVRNSIEIARTIASPKTSVVILPYACHTITKGEDSRQVEDEILGFVGC